MEEYREPRTLIRAAAEAVGRAVGGAKTLNELDDVVITTPADNQILTYDLATGMWINEPLPAPPTVITVHANLTGLAADDHTQYHNDTRGDARYTRKSNNLSDVANTTTARTNLGAAATSHVHAGADISSGTVAVARLGTGTPTASNVLRGDGAFGAVPGLITAHSGLSGLSADDHTQYYNQTRGDARYPQLVHVHAAADTTSGVFAVARLGSGTGTNKKWLRGDGAWQAYPQEIAFTFSGNGAAYYITTGTATVMFGDDNGTGTLTYAIAPDQSSTFGSNVTLPQTLLLGQTLRVTASGVSGFKTVTLVRFEQ